MDKEGWSTSSIRYDPFRRHLSEEAIENLADLIDIVEVWNVISADKDFDAPGYLSEAY